MPRHTLSDEGSACGASPSPRARPYDSTLPPRETETEMGSAPGGGARVVCDSGAAQIYLVGPSDHRLALVAATTRLAGEPTLHSCVNTQNTFQVHELSLARTTPDERATRGVQGEKPQSCSRTDKTQIEIFILKVML